MISGFNTDIEHGGIVYHVQTEDKGLNTPLILSLVYTGGAILAAKRSSYEDLISSGFDESILTERLQRQHRLICAAIKQGRVEDLKRMNAREPVAKAEVSDSLPKASAKNSISIPAQEIAVELLEIDSLNNPPVEDVSINISEPTIKAETFSQPIEEKFKAPIELGQNFVRVLRVEAIEQVADFARAVAHSKNALNLTLLEERDFRGGERVDLKIRLTQNSRAINNAEVMVKILGAAFRPVILHSATNADGVAIVHLQLPSFRTGRAALLIRVNHNNLEAELRRIILQG